MSECSSVEKIYPEPVTEIRGPLFQLMARMVDEDQETPGILLRTLRILELKLLDSVCLR